MALSDLLKVRQEVLAFFAPYMHFSPAGGVQFPYEGNAGETVTEILEPACHRVPSTTAMWRACSHYAQAVKHCFLFNSAVEVLCFSHYRMKFVSGTPAVAFVSLGMLPSCAQLTEIREVYPNAKLHTAFGSDLPGRVMDCKIALWMKGRDALFSLDGENIKTTCDQQSFSIACQEFSLNRFCKAAGLRTNIRTHQPEKGFCSFLEMLTDH